MIPGYSSVNHWETGKAFYHCQRVGCDNLVYGSDVECCYDCNLWRIAFFLIYQNRNQDEE